MIATSQATDSACGHTAAIRGMRIDVYQRGSPSPYRELFGGHLECPRAKPNRRTGRVRHEVGRVRFLEYAIDAFGPKAPPEHQRRAASRRMFWYRPFLFCESLIAENIFNAIRANRAERLLSESIMPENFARFSVNSP